MPTPIGTLGSVDTVTVGGRSFTDVPNLIILSMYIGGSGNFTTGRKANGTAGYQVTAGKTYTIGAIRGYLMLASAGTTIQSGIGYADNDIGLDQNTTPTNPVYAYGASTAAVFAPYFSQLTLELPVLFGIPQNKYVFTLNSDGTKQQWYTFGYEA